MPDALLLIFMRHTNSVAIRPCLNNVQIRAPRLDFSPLSSSLHTWTSSSLSDCIAETSRITHFEVISLPTN